MFSDSFFYNMHIQWEIIDDFQKTYQKDPDPVLERGVDSIIP